MAFCTSCGTKITYDGAKFCASCGTAIKPAVKKEEKHMHPTLQKIIDADTETCLHPPATLMSIAQFEEKHGVMLPAYYRKFLLSANGGSFFDLAGPIFYGLDPVDDGYSLEKEGMRKHEAYELPESLFVVGRTSSGDLLCIDLDSQKFVQWNHESCERYSFDWASIFDYLEEEFENYEEDEEDEEEEENESAYIPMMTSDGIQELFHDNEDSLFVLFNKGILAGQMIYMSGWMLDNGCFTPDTSSARQIPPVSRDAIPPWKELKKMFIRDIKIPSDDLTEMYCMLRAYVEKNPGVIDLDE